MSPASSGAGGGGDLTAGSLFSGIGLMDLGVERAGFRVLWQSEVAAYPRRVLRLRFPEAELHGDVRALDPAALAPVDLIFGGFPCQPVSVAGKRKGVGDERWLWPEVRRVVAALRPRAVLIENVPGLKSTATEEVLEDGESCAWCGADNAGGGGPGGVCVACGAPLEQPADGPVLTVGLAEVLRDLAALGYDAEWQGVPAAAVGAPHLRWRVFIVAYPSRADGPGHGLPERAGGARDRGAAAPAGGGGGEATGGPEVADAGEDGRPAGGRGERPRPLAGIGGGEGGARDHEAIPAEHRRAGPAGGMALRGGEVAEPDVAGREGDRGGAEGRADAAPVAAGGAPADVAHAIGAGVRGGGGPGPRAARAEAGEQADRAGAPDEPGDGGPLPDAAGLGPQGPEPEPARQQDPAPGIRGPDVPDAERGGLAVGQPGEQPDLVLAAERPGEVPDTEGIGPPGAGALADGQPRREAEGHVRARDVPHAHGAGHEGAGRGDEPEGPQRHALHDGRTLPDAEGRGARGGHDRRQRGVGGHEAPRVFRPDHAGRALRDVGGERWPAEPDLGELADGLPADLAAQLPGGGVGRTIPIPGGVGGPDPVLVEVASLPVPRIARGIPERRVKIEGLGNAVVPKVAELVARMVRYALEEGSV